ncbi:MAG: hypothetical protein HYY04_13220 [Chloroflexi bacterium]|nr:hypothetical protein [Chloroflexota bacterium]
MNAVGGEERGDDGAAVHLGRGLGEVLEEVGEPAAPDRIEPDLLEGVHQDLVDEDECRQTFPGRQRQELGEQVLGGSALPLDVLTLRVEQPETRGPGDLEGEGELS